MATTPHQKVDLPSQFFAIPPSVVDLTIKAGGRMNAPGRFVAAKNEVVVWAVTNRSGEQITVKPGRFLHKKNLFDRRGDPNAPADDFFNWVKSQSLRLKDGETGYLYARIAKQPQNPLGDHLSYSIDVRGSSFWIEYDPDGDIKP